MAKLKKRADGRYQRRITLSDGRSKLVYGRSLAALNEAEEAVRAEDRSGLVVGDHTLVGEWAKVWIETYKSGLRPNTVRMYRDTYNLHIRPFLGSMELQAVRPVHVMSVMASVSGSSESQQKKVLLTMRQIFAEARRNRLMNIDPTEGVKITPHATEKKKEYLSMPELKTFIEALSALDDKRPLLFCALCSYCGLRKEEALGLKWSDIEGGRLTVRRALTFSRGHTDSSMELKSKAAHRVLPVPVPLQEILTKAERPCEWIIPTTDGRQMTDGGFKRMWAKAARSSEIHIHPHMLRHTYATNLYRAGVPLRAAQKLLGHSSIQMTANIYTHLEDEDAMAVGGQIDAYLANFA